MIAVVGDFGEERGHPGLGPISPDDGEDVTQDVRFCDGSVDIADDNFIRIFPPVDMAVASTSPLVSRCHAELGFIGSRTKVEAFLWIQNNIML